MSSSKNIYSPEEAAAFLGISILELQQLTRRGDITLRIHKRKEYYLGGELDCVRINVRERLKIAKIPA